VMVWAVLGGAPLPYMPTITHTFVTARLARVTVDCVPHAESSLPPRHAKLPGGLGMPLPTYMTRSEVEPPQADTVSEPPSVTAPRSMLANA